MLNPSFSVDIRPRQRHRSRVSMFGMAFLGCSKLGILTPIKNGNRNSLESPATFSEMREFPRAVGTGSANDEIFI